MELKRATIELKPALKESVDALFRTRTGTQCNVIGVGAGMSYVMGQAFARLVASRFEIGTQRCSMVVYVHDESLVQDLFHTIHAMINSDPGIPMSLTVPSSAWTMKFERSSNVHYVSYSYQNAEDRKQYLRIHFVVVDTHEVQVESGFDMSVLYHFDFWCERMPKSFVELLCEERIENDVLQPVVVYTNLFKGRVQEWSDCFEDYRTITTQQVNPEFLKEIPESVREESPQYARDYLCKPPS
jgi:hypothetical protein